MFSVIKSLLDNYTLLYTDLCYWAIKTTKMGEPREANSG